MCECSETVTLQDSNAMNFRYNVVPKQRVHTFEPKALPTDTDLLQLRHSQLGAVYASNKQLLKLPAKKHVGLAWDVPS